MILFFQLVKQKLFGTLFGYYKSIEGKAYVWYVFDMSNNSFYLLYQH